MSLIHAGKDLARAVFRGVGLDVRLRSQLAANAAAEKREALIAPWKQLLRYSPATILDIGAHEGHSARMFRKLMPDVTIYSFEPLADCYQHVTEFITAHPPGMAFQCALSDVEETTSIYRNEFTASSSLLPMDKLHSDEFPHTANAAKEQIHARRLDDVAAEIEMADPLVVKIDVQGLEDRVIRGGEQTLQRAVAIVIELSSYSLYEGQPLFADVHEQLARLGFVYRGTIDQMLSPKDGRILQFDGLFENTRIVDASA